MISNAAVLCLLLFSAGQLAAASKSFGGGGGGYGEEAGGQHEESEVLAQLPRLTPEARPVNNNYKAPEKAWSHSHGPEDESPTPAAPSKSSSTPPAVAAWSYSYGPEDESPTPATPGTPSSSSSTTPASSGGSSSTPSSTTTPAGAGYGLDPAGEPEYGLNQKAIDDILKEHNAFRAKEHVPPLSWNATLAKFSQQYAEKTLKGPCKMVHSTSPYGENLMLGTGGITWKTTVDQWSDEKRSYHYGSNSCDAGKMCGHYTAVVWKGTTTVGCGRVKCNNGDTMIMCSYWPPGNYDGASSF
ncbi:hypothetical protein SETIT_3G402800v2 [Setaria italica]|uniref:SCP domain-containing protein n=1 Tax=Setaria italica TaxID=4555 RepID=A0A368QQW8_SETIT|nr:hypothetical protein SETIT_3G402800v2 [Setaria italica]